MGHRTFTATETDPSPPGPTFDLAGARRNGEPWSETFDAVHGDDVPPGVMADLALAVWVQEGELQLSRAGVLGFFDKVLVPESRARFDELVRDVDRRVKLPLLADAMMWLTSEWAEGPTGGQPNSPDGLSETEGSSGGTSPAPDSEPAPTSG